MVADLLIRHSEARTTGILVLGRGHVERKLFLHDGILVHAESNLREEALGEVLVAMGLLPAPRLNKLLAEVKRRQQRMGTVLLDLGWATPDDVLRGLAEQVRVRAVGCLRWSENQTRFDSNLDFVGTVIEHRFDLPELVFAGLRDTTSLETVTAELDWDQTTVVRLDDRFARYRAEFTRAFGQAVPQALADGTDLGAFALRPDAHDILSGLEALLCAGLARVEGIDQAVPEPVGTGSDSGAISAPTTAETHALDEPTSGARSLLGSHGGQETPTGVLESGSGGARPGALAQGRGRRAGWEDLPAALVREYLSIHARTPSEVLGVIEHAAQDEVHEAFERKSARLALLAKGGDLSPKMQELLDAYVRARDSLLCATMPDAQADLREVADTDPGRDPLGAELSFNEAERLIKVGRYEDALPLLRQAVDRRPDQATYHAWLGWTLLRALGKKAALPEALDRLEHAVAVDPDSAVGHGLLGNLLVILGEVDRAKVHLERTLALKPEQSEAFDLLARLHVEAAEHVALERLYRQVLTQLGEREHTLRARLWRELGAIHENTPGREQNAAEAYAKAAALEPHDRRLAEKAARLAAESRRPE